MSQITGLINWENINLDIHNTAIHKALINPWIISGLAVTTGQVAVGDAFIECTRSNGEKIMVHFMNTAPLNLDTSGNKKIFIEVKQEHIDNGILNAEDGSNIAEIKSSEIIPEKNFLLLAQIRGSEILQWKKISLKNISRKAESDKNWFVFYENGEEKIINDLPENIENQIINKISGTIEKTAWENIIWTGPIPVVCFDNEKKNIDVMAQKIPNAWSYQNPYKVPSANYDWINSVIINPGSYNSAAGKYRITSSFIIDLGKIRKISSLSISLSNENNWSTIRFYRSNINWDYIEITNFYTYRENISNKKIDINNELRFLKIGVDAFFDMTDLKIFEEIVLDWVYMANWDVDIFKKVDWFVFNSVNKWQKIEVKNVHLFNSIAGFNNLNNKKIFLSGKGLITTTENSNFLWVVKNNNLLFDSRSFLKDNFLIN